MEKLNISVEGLAVALQGIIHSHGADAGDMADAEARRIAAKMLAAEALHDAVSWGARSIRHPVCKYNKTPYHCSCHAGAREAALALAGAAEEEVAK